MSTAYQGRHGGGLHRPQASRRPRIRTTVHGLTGALRRPLASAAAILAVAAVSAAGSSSSSSSSSSAMAATANISGASFTPSPMAVAQATELSRNKDDTDTSLASARRLGVQRAAVLTQRQQAAAVAAALARVEATKALLRARVEAAQRVARDKERQDLLVRARTDPKALARLLAADRGWDGQQFGCLDSLWSKESGWRWNANNPGSGAYGIPQALPGSKMASSGSDWSTNPSTQINWGLQYVARIYGTPCSAWAHSQATNWY